MKWQQDVWFVCETNLTPTLNVWEISDAADFTSPLVVFWWNIKTQTSQTLSPVLKHTLVSSDTLALFGWKNSRIFKWVPGIPYFKVWVQSQGALKSAITIVCFEFWCQTIFFYKPPCTSLKNMFLAHKLYTQVLLLFERLEWMPHQPILLCSVHISYTWHICSTIPQKYERRHLQAQCMF